MIMLAVAAIAMPQTAEARGAGEKTLGLMGGYSSYNEGGFMDVYFQYTFAEHFRIAPDLGYSFRNDGKSAFLMDVDMHFPFRVAKGFALYPLVGLTLNNWNYSHGGTATRFGGNFGGGMELYLTSYLKMTLQAKYSLMNDTSGAFVGLGLGYVF